jgi:hypothetical protein
MRQAALVVATTAAAVSSALGETCSCFPVCSAQVSLAELLASGAQYSVLTCSGVVGTVPVTIGQQRSLSDLEFWDSPELVGPLPAELGGLGTLSSLVVVNAPNLTGALPSSIGSLGQLKSLRLEATRLGGVLADFFAGPRPNLRTLQVVHNSFSGELSRDFLANLPNLVTLNVGHNNLAGALPDPVWLTGAKLTSYVVAYNARLSGPLPQSLLSGSIGVSTVDVRGTAACGALPSTDGGVTVEPSALPDCLSTAQPTTQPTAQPTALPTTQPTILPTPGTSRPTQQPSGAPTQTGQPSSAPTATGSNDDDDSLHNNPALNGSLTTLLLLMIGARAVMERSAF